MTKIKQAKQKLSVSFFLLNPEAKKESAVYCSISKDSKRLRFPIDKTFQIKYCNKRSKRSRGKVIKNSKYLVKAGSAMYLEYDSILTTATNLLETINLEFNRIGNGGTLAAIRDEYLVRTGIKQVEQPKVKTFNQAFIEYMRAEVLTDALIVKVTSTQSHLIKYQDGFGKFEGFGEIKLTDINDQLWNSIRDEYFVKVCKFSNSTTNKHMTFIKQFIRYAIKRKLITHELHQDDMKYLKEVEPFKIALKMPEVETLINLDLSTNPKLDRVRDLFILGIMTGQRWSDIPKLLVKDNISENHIHIYQKKTSSRVAIPIFPRLRERMEMMFKKYPKGMAEISNQKFNDYVKDLGKLAGFDRIHTWVTKTGTKVKEHSDFRYNLLSSHSMRRSFCTLSLKQNIPAKTIMEVTGHRKYTQFAAYCKVDDFDLNDAYNENFMK
jgi:site-specific recombinase XerD